MKLHRNAKRRRCPARNWCTGFIRAGWTYQQAATGSGISTGNTGRVIAGQLLDAGEDVRVIGRSNARRQQIMVV